MTRPFVYMGSVHVNDASDESKPSGEYLYFDDFDVIRSLSRRESSFILLSLGWFVKYYACVRRFIADLLHVPPNGYSPRPNVMIQYRAVIRWCGAYAKYGCWFGGEADSENFAIKESMKKAFKDMLHVFGGSKLEYKFQDQENFEDIFTLEALWKTLFVFCLYMIGTLVGVRTYLLDGAIDSGEANGIIRDPKLELESSRFTFETP
ncbi:hypothetical protein Tco_0348973 [Tanacetum coccineum]